MKKIEISIFKLLLILCESNITGNATKFVDTESNRSVTPAPIILKLIPRDQWFAQEPINKLNKLKLPTDRIIICHSATVICSSQAQCTYSVRNIQKFHIKYRGFDDIGYNFLIGGDGAIYEGRGWDYTGAHTNKFNYDSIGIVFIGTFDTKKPKQEQIDASKLLIQEGLRLRKIDPNYKLYGQRQLIVSKSPGDLLFDIIKKWSHWRNTTVIDSW